MRYYNSKTISYFDKTKGQGGCLQVVNFASLEEVESWSAITCDEPWYNKVLYVDENYLVVKKEMDCRNIR
eukprot:UN24543